jgi:hypothetical protein
VGRRITVVPWQSVEAEMKSLFPFDFCGVYDRDKFLLIGGYDPEIGNPYWQKMDFGFRAFLWGEQIVCDTNLEVGYMGDVPLENSTPDTSYKVFYLKNIAVKYKNSFGVLPFRRCLPYMFHSDTGPLYSLKEFLTVRKWVKENRMRFKRDSRDLVGRWEVPG